MQPAFDPAVPRAGLPGGAVPGAGASAGVIGPPLVLLLAGLLVPLAALGLLFLGGLPAWVSGWVVAIVGSTGALAVFTRIDLERRASRWYVDRPALLGALRVAVLVVGLVVAGWFAYLIADQVARMDIWFR